MYLNEKEDNNVVDGFVLSWALRRWMVAFLREDAPVVDVTTVIKHYL